MAINITLDKHAVCFPSKVLAGNGGAHIYNIVLEADTDNGTIVSRGDYVSFDQYKAAAAPGGYSAVIREQAADGNWYVEVVEPADAVLICEVFVDTSSDPRLKGLQYHFNPAGETVRGYALAKGDIYELSAEGFTGTPEAGQTVTISGQKHVVA